VGAITLGTLIGTSFGIAAALITEAALDVHHISENGAEWVAVAMLGLVIWMTVVFFALWLSKRPRLAPGMVATKGGGLRRVVLNGRILLYAAAIYGLALGLVAYLKGCVGLIECDPARLGLWPERWTANLPEVTLFGFTFPDISVFGIDFNLGNPADIAKALIILGPAYFVVRRVFLGARDLDRRRQIGILWDVGSFLPRAFHPLGPPAYGPNAVESLKAAVRNPATAYLGIDPEASRHSDEKLDILSAHSQGSLVAAVMLDQLTDAELPNAFLTYGSQLGILYPKMFSSIGIDRLVSSLEARLDQRWINLWRDTDPIGGQPATSLDRANWRVETGSGHSRYELTPEFCQARNNLIVANTDQPPHDQLKNCWDHS
jgi:hypothetical protein